MRVVPARTSSKPARQGAALVAGIREYCAANANPALAAKYARYFKEGYDSWGLWDPKHEFWNERQQDWLAAYSGLDLSAWLSVGEQLLSSGKYEEGAIAIRFLHAHDADLSDATLSQLARWFNGGIRNWAHVDVLCAEVLGPALAGGRVSLDALGAWRKSEHKYQRRAALVALLSLVKTAKTPGPLLKYIEPALHDSERVVNQGCGWVLREIWKRWPEPVEALLSKHKETAPRVVVQYATEKMTAERKAQFRRTSRK